MKDFRDLQVWQKVHQVVLNIYRVTAKFPGDELYGLRSQLRRCSVSMPANIAEGCGKGTDKDFSRFLQIAMGSACELEYHLLLSRDLSYIERDQYESICSDLIEAKKMLAGLIRRLRADR